MEQNKLPLSVETVTATEAERRFSEILDLVRSQGKSCGIRRGKEHLAHSVPTAAAHSVKVVELKSLVAELPALTRGELESFAADLQGIRATTGSPPQRWE